MQALGMFFREFLKSSHNPVVRKSAYDLVCFRVEVVLQDHFVSIETFVQNYKHPTFISFFDDDVGIVFQGVE